MDSKKLRASSPVVETQRSDEGKKDFQVRDTYSRVQITSLHSPLHVVTIEYVVAIVRR